MSDGIKRMIARVERINAAIAKWKPCCATMGFNVSIYERRPGWIKGKCPWCQTKLEKL